MQLARAQGEPTHIKCGWPARNMAWCMNQQVQLIMVKGQQACGGLVDHEM